MSLSRQSLRVAITALIAAAGLAATASSANAGILVASAPSCEDQSLSKTFLPWLDIANYTALSGGDFETGAAGWSMTGGAAVANGNEPYYVGAATDSKSLSLPSGSSATSPTMCVGILHPTIRFFVKKRTAGLLSSMRVDVLFETAAGDVASLPVVGIVTNGGNWQPTLPMVVVANLLPLLPGEMTPVRFRFTPVGNADWSVDDVWVDPYARR